MRHKHHVERYRQVLRELVQARKEIALLTAEIERKTREAKDDETGLLPRWQDKRFIYWMIKRGARLPRHEEQRTWWEA
jgi:cell division protein FtsB